MRGASAGVGAAEKLDRLLHDAWAAWCARFGPRLQIVAESPAIREKIVLRPASRTVWQNPLEDAYYGAGAGRAIVEHPESALYRLADVSVTGSEVLLFTGAHTLLRLDPSQNTIETRKARRPIAWRARRVDGPVMPLGGRGTGNRGHFLCEHLPRLLLAREHLGAHLPLRVLLTPGHGSWQREYLVRLGEDAARAVEGSRGTLFCPEAWFVPNLSRDERADLYEPGVYREIARRFKRGLAPRDAGRRLFVTRKDAPSRRLANEDEAYAACAAAFPGLERVAMSGMSLGDQIALFAQAEVVIGAHSQAFRNLLYCEDVLALQLVPGRRDPANGYHVWAANYDRLGLVHGNRCLSLYAGEPYADGDWVFPLDALRAALFRLNELGAAR
jgi:capsular polysaccharide biosynthesis protein